jgi:hypothetical protein
MKLTESNPTEKIVKKTRIIAAILSELGASKALVLFSCGITKKTVSCQIVCNLKNPFEESELKFIGLPKNITNGIAVCCFASHRIVFNTEIHSSDPKEQLWELPNQIKMIDLRQERRWRFPENQYSCEIIGERGSVYGYAVDINRDCIAVDMDSIQNLKINDRYKLIIRMVNTNSDVFFIDCKLLLLTGNDTEGLRGIFNINVDKPTKTFRRSSMRHEVSSFSIMLTGSPFSDFRSDIDFKIDNVSSGGLTLCSRPNNSEYTLVPGMILKAKHPKISLLVIWESGERFGCRPLLQSREVLSIWYQFLNEINPPADRKVSTSRQDFADLLTHSGLLKGDRRLPFGNEIGDHLITHPEVVSPLLVQRHYSRNSNEETEMHVSAKRISDTSWFFGDGIALTENRGMYNDMLDSCTDRLTQLATESSFFPRYLTGIWHEKIKSTAKWGFALAENSQTNLFNSINVRFSKLHDISHNSEAKVTSLATVSAEIRWSLGHNFSPSLLESLVGLDGTHPVLNTELSKFGPYHRAESKIVEIDSETTVIAHRIITYGIWSNTGVTNSVFVLVPNNCSAESLLIGLKSLVEDEISFGTDDLLVIFEKDYPYRLDETLFKKDRYFTYLVHDLRLQSAPEQE